ncbi:MAG: histidine kinase [Gemmatirosa sp.]|nr:histidine kinase [Gemmatirosa sp.]
MELPPSDDSPPAPSPRVWPAVLACWTVLGLLESTSAYVQTHQNGHPRTVAQVLVGNMPWWLLWGLFTPVALAVTRRWPLHGRRWPRSLAVQAGAAFAVSSAHLLLEGTIFYYTSSRGLSDYSLTTALRRLYVSYFVLDVVTYLAIVGACHALDFYARLRDSSLRAARLELGLAQARMQALRMELNPHFFFNALNAISGLVRRHDNDAAVRMLARLGELLRVTLDHDLPPEIALDDELALLDRYLDIERVRFGDRLTFDVACDADARRALVPSLVLQPLVENAVRHGVAKQPGAACVAVRAERAGAELRVTVSDTGAGLAPRTVGAVRLREGIGLSNTRARLAELYGARGVLTLDGAPGGGCRATITLPFRATTTRDVEAAGVALGA